MKERFGAKEWERLQRLPIMMFQFVSLADRELQKEEAEAFALELQDALKYKDPLHSELFADLVRKGNFQKAFEAAVGIATESAEAIDQEFLSTKKVLEEKLTFEEYHRFFVSLTGTGMKVAEAAGEGPDRFSSEEQTALVVFLNKFAVDMEAGKKALADL